MNWKKSVVGVMLLSIMIAAMIGCGKTGQPAVTPSAPIATSTLPTPTTTDTRVGRPSIPTMDLAAAATKLGVTEQQLRDALGTDTQRPPDLAAAAKKLGITEEALQEALGFQGDNSLQAFLLQAVPKQGPLLQRVRE